ncbi:hypothetical protein E9119_24080, partial [Salmonella enterica subsp. enterica serovar Goldcoast]
RSQLLRLPVSLLAHHLVRIVPGQGRIIWPENDINLKQTDREERRVGKEWGGWCGVRGSPDH